ncbi:stage V sporulation protein AA [Domibacillus tundrae]|uniref:stage V sporulation protein AA n=1 Tax=Domibacillus tundrae TaxID=1587527 RepID=UPI0006182970|nr:stage V sporulation protein AA [Domibacillus tundrae]
MEQIVYISLKRHVRLDERRISFFDVAEAEVGEEAQPILEKLVIKTVQPSAGNVVIVTVLDVIHALKTEFPDTQVVIAGETESIVSLQPANTPASFWKIALVWIVLFTGAALTIMNFHEDVSMQKVHVLIYEKITGVKNEQPLLLQIPYSIGLGLGMILFFNRLWQKRLNEEPGPLDLEMFKYEEDINGYLAANEKDQP